MRQSECNASHSTTVRDGGLWSGTQVRTKAARPGSRWKWATLLLAIGTLTLGTCWPRGAKILHAEYIASAPSPPVGPSSAEPARVAAPSLAAAPAPGPGAVSVFAEPLVKIGRFYIRISSIAYAYYSDEKKLVVYTMGGAPAITLEPSEAQELVPYLVSPAVGLPAIAVPPAPPVPIPSALLPAAQ